MNENGVLSSRTINNSSKNIYNELGSPSREIRILTLHTGTIHAPIRCTLRHVSILDIGQFTALSYAWGSPLETEEILIRSQTGRRTSVWVSMRVRKNAWEFLRHIRQARGDIDIWIDSLCINQENQYEKKHQLKLMAEIYGRATDVYAWLGESTPDSVTAFKMIREYQRQQKSHRCLSDKEFQRCLRDVIDRDYWSRFWIIQEVLLARNVWLVVGSDMINWNVIRRFFDGFVLPYVNRSASRQNLRAIVDHEDKENPDISMASLLARYHLSQCCYLRDKIYGILGLVDEGIKDAIDVDLESPLLQVCADNMAVLLVEPIKLQRAGLKAIRSYSLPPGPVWEVIVNVYGRRFSQLQRLARNASLRNQLKIDISVFAVMRWCRFRCHTFAGISRGHHRGKSPVLPLKRFYSPRHYQAFISRIDLLGIDSNGDQDMVFFNGFHPAFLYSTVHPAPGDILLDLWSSWLIARRINGVLQVVDIAALGATNSLCWRVNHGTYSPGVLPENITIRGMVNPLRWLEGRIPDLQIELASKPQIHKRGVSWDVRLNGAGLAEAARNQYLLQHIPKWPSVDWDPLTLTEWSNRKLSKHGLRARSKRRSKRYNLRPIGGHLDHVRERSTPDSSKGPESYTLDVLLKCPRFKWWVSNFEYHPEDILEVMEAREGCDAHLRLRNPPEGGNPFFYEHTSLY